MIKIKKLREDFVLPAKQTKGSSGYDLTCCRISLNEYFSILSTIVHVEWCKPLWTAEGIILPPGTRFLFPLGFSLELPEGLEAQIRSRSGLTLRSGIIELNSPGTIDSDYRGEVGAIISNMGQENITIMFGTRIAQLIFARTESFAFELTDSLTTSGRGTGGFGHSGT